MKTAELAAEWVEHFQAYRIFSPKCSRITIAYLDKAELLQDNIFVPELIAEWVEHLGKYRIFKPENHTDTIAYANEAEIPENALVCHM